MIEALIAKLSSGEAVAKGSVFSSVDVAHWLLTQQYGAINATVRHATEGEEAFWVASLRDGTATVLRNINPTGFFTDLDGKIRSFNSPGDGLRCQYVYRGCASVNVIDGAGIVVFQATLYASVEAIEAGRVEAVLAN